VFYLTVPSDLIEGPLRAKKSALHVFDMKKRRDATVVEGLSGYAISADGARSCTSSRRVHRRRCQSRRRGPGGAGDDGPRTLDLSHLRVRVDPRQEWREMFANAWRIERDFFFSTKDERRRLGRGARTVREAAAAVGSRTDLNYLLGR